MYIYIYIYTHTYIYLFKYLYICVYLKSHEALHVPPLQLTQSTCQQLANSSKPLHTAWHCIVYLCYWRMLSTSAQTNLGYRIPLSSTFAPTNAFPAPPSPPATIRRTTISKLPVTPLSCFLIHSLSHHTPLNTYEYIYMYIYKFTSGYIHMHIYMYI